HSLASDRRGLERRGSSSRHASANARKNGRLTLHSSRPRAVRWLGASAPRASQIQVSVRSAREGTWRLSERTLAGRNPLVRHAARKDGGIAIADRDRTRPCSHSSLTVIEHQTSVKVWTRHGGAVSVPIASARQSAFAAEN